MRYSKIFFLTSLIVICGSITCAAQNWSTVYQTDFSVDSGGWIPSNSANYYWDSLNGWYFSENYTSSGAIAGDWATVDIPYDAQSFRFTCRIKPNRSVGDNGDVCVGLFGANRESHSGTEERIFILIGGFNDEIHLEGHNSGGEPIQSPEGIAAGSMANNQWHEVEILFDSLTNELSVSVTRNDSLVFTWSTVMNFGFSSSLENLGVSMHGSWSQAGRHQIAHIDDVMFQTACLYDYQEQFDDGSIDQDLWVTGGARRGWDPGQPIGIGPWTFAVDEITAPDGFLQMEVQGPTSGLTYGAEAWARTTYDFNDGLSHLINFTWGFEAVIPGHYDFVYMQITDGSIPPNGNVHWPQTLPAGTSNLLQTPSAAGAEYVTGFPKSTWSITIGLDGVARLFNGPNATGNLIHEEVLDPSYAWYFRMMVIDATSAGFTAGHDQLKLYDFSATCISAPPSGPIPHAWCEVFDEYAPGSKGAPAWYDGAGNTSGVSVDNTTAYTGTQSYKMFGLLGSCWGAIMYRDLSLTYPFSIELAVKNGTENLTGCHPYHASMEFKLGTKWWDPGVTGGFYFRNNGDFNPGVSGTDAPIAGFALDQWHIVRGEYSTPGDDSLHVKYWIDGIFVGEFTAPEPTQAPLYLGIAAQEGTAWFDDICVTPDTFSLYVDHVPMDALPGNCSNVIEVDAPIITDDTWQTTEAADMLGRKIPLSDRQATITIAIPGSADLDVAQLDGPVTRLQGQLPLSEPVFKDVTGPGPCDGTGSDGILDAVYTYDLNKVLKSYGSYKDGDELTLSLVGQLIDGRPLDAKDKILVHIRGRSDDSYTETGNAVAEFSLGANFPNPFNPSTKISFTLPTATHVTVEVFNVMGQRVTTLTDAEYTAGPHTVTWASADDNGAPVASGMYFYRMKAGDFVQTRKMVLLK